MRWIIAVLYCAFIVSLANIRSCQQDEVLHVGVYNNVQEISE